MPVQPPSLAGRGRLLVVLATSTVAWMFIYILLDVITQAGAFVWPARDGEPPPTPPSWTACSSP